MRKCFGVPVFCDTDKLLKYFGQKNIMDDTYDWTEDNRTLYEKTWVNREGDELYIEDATKILSPTEQTHLSNFDDDRYRVLEQGRFRPEAKLEDTFKELEDALGYVEENYEIEM